MTETTEPQKTTSKSGAKFYKIGVFAILLIALVVLYNKYGSALNLESLADREVQLREWGAKSPSLTLGVAFLIYVAVTGLSLPGAAVLTLVFGWFFGFGTGLVLVSFASTAGATLAFLLSRFFFRSAVQDKFGPRIQKFNEALEKEGSFYLFSLRLVPAFPFFVINLVMGLTPIKTWTYWWVSQLGMLPGTAVYVYAGSQLPSLATLKEKGASGILTPGMLIAFTILGLMPLTLKKLAPLLFKKNAAAK